MTAPKKLTSAEVVDILIRSKAVGTLTVTEHGDAVRITGPEQDRFLAMRVLFNHGLVASPYTDHDDYRWPQEADQ